MSSQFLASQRDAQRWRLLSIRRALTIMLIFIIDRFVQCDEFKLFNSTNSPKPYKIQFAITYGREKQKILTFWIMELTKVS